MSRRGSECLEFRAGRYSSPLGELVIRSNPPSEVQVAFRMEDIGREVIFNFSASTGVFQNFEVKHASPVLPDPHMLRPPDSAIVVCSHISEIVLSRKSNYRGRIFRREGFGGELVTYMCPACRGDPEQFFSRVVIIDRKIWNPEGDSDVEIVSFQEDWSGQQTRGEEE